MHIFLHADDFGISKSVTDNITACFSGALNSMSIIPNGSAFDYAMDAFDQLANKDKRVSVHLNFIEGKPLSPIDEVSLLVDDKGDFCHSFFSLLAKYYLSGEKTKDRLRRQIRAEASAQMARVRDRIPADDRLNVDSHQHYHLLPFIFREIVNLGNDFNIGYIRVPKEKFVYDPVVFFRMPINLVKFMLLNYLSGKCLAYLKGSSIRYPDYFIGVLRTGAMNAKFIEKSLRAIRSATGRNDKDITVEILLHPGGATSEEAYLWDKYPEIRNFYLSDDRVSEKDVLMDTAFLASHKVDT